MLGFRDLGASFSSLGCFVLRYSVFGLRFRNYLCKVVDHWEEHRCDCVRTERNLSVLEQNLKGQHIRIPGLFPSRKELCP